MANYTAHYHLHQWEPEDSFLRRDFNEDFQKIDAGLAGREMQLLSALMWVRELAARPSLPHLHWGFQPRRFG